MVIEVPEDAKCEQFGDSAKYLTKAFVISVEATRNYPPVSPVTCLNQSDSHSHAQWDDLSCPDSKPDVTFQVQIQFPYIEYPTDMWIRWIMLPFVTDMQRCASSYMKLKIYHLYNVDKH